MKALRASCILLAIATAAWCQEPLLTNGGFEEVADGAPAGWRLREGGAGTAIELSPDARSGERCMRLVDDATGKGTDFNITVRQYVDIGPGPWIFSAWIRSEGQSGPRAVYMQVRLLPANEAYVVEVAPPADDQWRRYSVAVRAPEGTEQCQVYVYTQDDETSVTLVDDAGVRRADPDELDVRFATRAWGFDGLEEPRELNLHTPIVTEQGTATLVAPEDAQWRAVAEDLRESLRERTGQELPLRSWERGDSTDGTLIALGNVYNNALIELLYFNDYCRADALFPGEGEYVLRTVHEPYTFDRGQNVVIIGASDVAGAERGVQRLLEMLGDSPRAALDGKVLEVSSATRYTESQRQQLLSQELVMDWFTDFYRAVWEYRDSGDLAWAERARDILLACADRYVEKPRFDVTWPEETTSGQIGRAWDVVEEAPVFTDEQRLRCENALAVCMFNLTTHTYEWGDLHRSDTITWNHITHPLIGVYFLARWFDRFRGGLEGRTEAMLGQVNGCFQGQMSSWKPREDAMGYCRSSPRHTMRWSLGEGDYSYFESGNARKWAEYMTHCSNNRGDGSGFGDHPYDFRQYEVQMLPWALWYYEDGRYLWRLNQLDDEWQNPYDPSIKPEPWDELVGATVVPLHPEVYHYTEESAYYGEEPAPPNVPIEKAFDKIALRASLEPEAPYMLIDGYSRGKHLQYDGNCIVRYYADGEDWLIDDDYLVRNTTDHTMLSIIHNGRADELEPPCASLEHSADLPHATLLQTGVYDYNGADWRRSLCWLKDRSFAMIDEVEAAEAGAFTVDCIFKLLDRGEQELIDGRTMVTRRRAGKPVGSQFLVQMTDPAPGVAHAVKFERDESQLEFGVELPAGRYQVTLHAYGLSGGTNSFFVSVDGGEPVAFHLPVREFGPSSASWSGEGETPSLDIAESGMHRVTITPREGPGVMLDRIEFATPEGELVRTIEAEDAPPVPKELVPEAQMRRFFIRSDGRSRASTPTRLNNEGLGIRYLRERLQTSLAKRERCAFQNVFYNDRRSDPLELDVRRINDANALLLRDGRPWGVFGCRADELDLPGELATDAALYLFTPEFICLADGRQLTALTASDEPASVELDLATGRMHMAGSTDAPAPGADAVKALAGPVRDLLATVSRTAMEPRTEPLDIGAQKGLTEVWRLNALGDASEQVNEILPVDLTGDNTPEIVVLRANEVLCLDAQGQTLWRQTTGGRARSAAVANLTGDGEPEVLVGAEDEAFYVYSAAGELLHRHNVDVGLLRGSGHTKTPKVGQVGVTDLEGDGETDVVIACLSGHLIRYDTDWQQQWIYPTIAHGTLDMQFVDLLGDDRKETLCASRYGRLYVIDADGKRQTVIYSEIGDVAMDVGDITGDGEPEVINGSSTGSMRCWSRADGYTWDFNNYGYAHADVKIADLGKGPRVLVASATGHVYVLTPDGEVEAQAALSDAATNMALRRLPDGGPQVFVTCSDGTVVRLDADLQPLSGARMDTPAVLVETMQAADLALVGCQDGTVVALRAAQ